MNENNQSGYHSIVLGVCISVMTACFIVLILYVTDNSERPAPKFDKGDEVTLANGDTAVVISVYEPYNYPTTYRLIGDRGEYDSVEEQFLKLQSEDKPNNE